MQKRVGECAYKNRTLAAADKQRCRRQSFGCWPDLRTAKQWIEVSIQNIPHTLAVGEKLMRTFPWQFRIQVFAFRPLPIAKVARCCFKEAAEILLVRKATAIGDLPHEGVGWGRQRRVCSTRSWRPQSKEGQPRRLSHPS